MIKNKKGQIGASLVGIVILGIIVTIILALTIFSSYKWIIIGIGILVGAFILLANAFKSDGDLNKGKLTIVLILLAISMIFVFYGNVMQQTIGGYEYVNVPHFGYYECAPARETLATAWAAIPVNQQVTTDLKCPKWAEKCDITLRAPIESGFWNTFLNNYKLVYSKCDGICTDTQHNQLETLSSEARAGSGNYAEVTIYNVLKTQTVTVGYFKKDFRGNFNSIAGGEYRMNYQPFILWKVSLFDGGKTPYTEIMDDDAAIGKGCDFAYTETKNFVTSASPSLSTKDTANDLGHKDTVTYQNYLNFYQTKNFVDTFVPVSVENYKFVTYNSKSGYCLNKKVYGIDTITTASGSYKIVNYAYNDVLGEVACCPGDSEPTRYCSSAMTWIAIKPDTPQECSSFKPCTNSEKSVISCTKLGQTTCNTATNKCDKQITTTVECTADSCCPADKPTCDRTSNKCVSVAPPKPLCGDGICSVGEEETCSADCEKSPLKCNKWYQEVGTKTTIIKSWYNYIGIGTPTTVTTPVCQNASWLPLLVFGGIILILGTTLIVIWKPKEQINLKRNKNVKRNINFL